MGIPSEAIDVAVGNTIEKLASSHERTSPSKSYPYGDRPIFFSVTTWIVLGIPFDMLLFLIVSGELLIIIRWSDRLRLSRGLETGFLAKISALTPNITKETRFGGSNLIYFQYFD